MSPDKQRIAIAEACGFSEIAAKAFPAGIWSARHAEIIGWVNVPDYTTDLNAMHEAEKVLTSEQQSQYAFTLHDMHGIPLATFWHRVVCPTAAQRAEAFLRTIGKWEGEK